MMKIYQFQLVSKKKIFEKVVQFYMMENVIEKMWHRCFEVIKIYQMKKTKHSNSLRAKNTGQIHLLEDRLFSKFQGTEAPEHKYDDLEFKMMNDTPDALSDLIGRARGITSQNRDKIQLAKRQLRVSKKDTAGTFLTGTGIYAEEVEEEEPPPYQYEPEIDSDALLKDLTRTGEYDDLAQLRRMIKKTGQNLDGYSKEVYQIKKQVMNAASQFKSNMDFGLSYKLNRLQDPTKKTKSVAGIKESRYH